MSRIPHDSYSSHMPLSSSQLYSMPINTMKLGGVGSMCAIAMSASHKLHIPMSNMNLGGLSSVSASQLPIHPMPSRN